MANVRVEDCFSVPLVTLPPIVRGDAWAPTWGIYTRTYDDDFTTVLSEVETDLTGRTYKLLLAVTFGGEAVVDHDVEIVAAATGKIRPALTPTQTASLTAVRYWGRLVENPGTSDERTLFRILQPMISGVDD